MDYLWLLPVLLPAVAFFWCCCDRPRIVTKYDTSLGKVSQFLPSGSPTGWTAGIDVKYASGIGALVGCGVHSTDDGSASRRVNVWRCDTNFVQDWAVYQGTEYGNYVYPTSIAVLPDGTSCVAEIDQGGFGSTSVRYLIHDADGNEVADAAIASSNTLGLATTDGTDFFVLYVKSSSCWVLQLDSTGSTVADWDTATTSTGVRGFVATGGDLYILLSNAVRKVVIGATGSALYVIPVGHQVVSHPPSRCLHAGSDGNLYFITINNSTLATSVRSVTTAGTLNWSVALSGQISTITDDGTHLYVLGFRKVLMSDGSLVTTGTEAITGSTGLGEMNWASCFANGHVFLTHAYSDT